MGDYFKHTDSSERLTRTTKNELICTEKSKLAHPCPQIHRGKRSKWVEIREKINRPEFTPRGGYWSEQSLVSDEFEGLDHASGVVGCFVIWKY